MKKENFENMLQFELTDEDVLETGIEIVLKHGTKITLPKGTQMTFDTINHYYVEFEGVNTCYKIPFASILYIMARKI